MNKISRRRCVSNWLDFQDLESRSLLAAVIDFDASSGVLSIDGTDQPDQVFVNYINDGFERLRVTAQSGQSVVARDFASREIREIRFEGNRGNDLFRNNTHRRSVVNGGAGADNLFGGWGSDVLNGGSGDDHLNGRFGDDDLNGGQGNDFIRGAAGNDQIDGWSGFDHLAGGSGDDTIFGGFGEDRIFGGSGNDVIDAGSDRDFVFGGVGDDTVDAGGGNDRIRGGRGDDVLDGGDGNDRISGEAGNDSLHGSAGSDLIYGGTGNDRIFGGDQSDRLFGDSGDDVIHGDDGNDSLYGGLGEDLLKGLDGDDGLFGGIGDVDRLEGGRGDDRLLSLVGEDGRLEDRVVQLTRDDAIVRFRDLPRHVETISGIGNVTFSAAAWTNEEVIEIDVALRNLHHTTGNTRLLKDHRGGTTVIQRAGSVIDSSFDLGGFSSGGVITLTDNAFGSPNRALAVTYHEFGHNWDQATENSLVTGFQAISGWRNSSAPGFTLSTGSNNWYHNDSADGFARAYGTWSPFEDYATTWETYFMVNHHRSNGWRGTDNVVAAKFANLDALFASLE